MAAVFDEMQGVCNYNAKNTQKEPHLSSIEIFLDDGRSTMLLPQTPNPKRKGVQIRSGEDNVIKINDLVVHELKSIWEGVEVQ